MKQIIAQSNTPVSEIFRPENFASNKRRKIGVMRDGARGFLMNPTYGGEMVHVICAKGMCHHNGWDAYNGGTLAYCIDQLLKNRFEVFEFNNERELLLWLADSKEII